MTILDKIVKDKRVEVALAKGRMPLSRLKKTNRPGNFSARSLRKTGRLQLIAEIKSKSPSAGLIRSQVDAQKLAKQFEAKYAAAISVLTDKKYFGGSLRDLSLVKAAVGVPVLRKEFIIDSYQLYQSRVYGADIVLLIAAVLRNRIGSFARLAVNLDLQPLIEVHTAAELKNVLKLVKPSKKIIIGINNRDLKTFKVRLNTSLRLVKSIPKKFIRISESGVFNIGQLKQLSEAGFDGVLIGTGLAKNPELVKYFR